MKLYANGILLNAAAQSVTLEKSRGDAAATLTAVLLTAAADRYFPKESLALGDLRYRCGAMVELHRKEFGLDGAYPLTAVKHRWERGLFTTELTWEGEA